MKVLALDIETSPNVVYTWGLWDQNVALNQIVSVSSVICFAAKFVGEKKMHFHSVYHDGRLVMLEAIHALLDEADVVLTYNGKRFDIPHLNREFIEADFLPPSPYYHLDLFQTCRSKFKFQSNKLAHISEQLGLEGKVEHEGFGLWLKCLDGDEKAWRKMARYNRRDVTLLEELYELVRPWISSHPNVGMYDDIDGCPRCGSTRYQKRGTWRTKVSEYVRFQCKDCGHYFRSTRREGHVTHTDIAAS